MGDGSPLFHSSLDLLAHACEHYVAGEERDRRLVVLHLANAIELLLKDRLLDLGISVYETAKQTKTISKALGDLEKAGVAIPIKPIIELLIDERNNLQHRFGSPNSIMVKYYFDNCLKFFEEFMDASFGLALSEYLSQLLDGPTLAYIYPDSEASKDVLLLARAVAKVHSSSSVLTAWVELEKKMGELRHILEENKRRKDEVWFRYPASPFLRRLLGEYMTPTEERDTLRKDIVRLSVTRNRVVHADIDLSVAEAESYIDSVEQVLPKLDRLKAELQEQVKAKGKSSPKQKKAVGDT